MTETSSKTKIAAGDAPEPVRHKSRHELAMALEQLTADYANACLLEWKLEGYLAYAAAPDVDAPREVVLATLHRHLLDELTATRGRWSGGMSITNALEQLRQDTARRLFEDVFRPLFDYELAIKMRAWKIDLVDAGLLPD